MTTQTLVSNGLDYYAPFADEVLQAREDFLSWAVSFEAAGDQLAIIQHILLGMNAHINLDLAMAAALVMEDKEIMDLEVDFHKVNGILADLTEEMQDKLARISPLMILLDWIGHRSDEKVIDFSIKIAREASWSVACQLSKTQGASREAQIDLVDTSIEVIAKRIRNPRTRLLRFALKVIKAFENKSASEIVRIIRRTDEEIKIIK